MGHALVHPARPPPSAASLVVSASSRRSRGRTRTRSARRRTPSTATMPTKKISRLSCRARSATAQERTARRQQPPTTAQARQRRSLDVADRGEAQQARQGHQPRPTGSADARQALEMSSAGVVMMQLRRGELVGRVKHQQEEGERARRARARRERHAPCGCSMPTIAVIRMCSPRGTPRTAPSIASQRNRIERVRRTRERLLEHVAGEHAANRTTISATTSSVAAIIRDERRRAAARSFASTAGRRPSAGASCTAVISSMICMVSADVAGVLLAAGPGFVAELGLPFVEARSWRASPGRRRRPSC